MAPARDERHRYGQHYTPVSVARLLAAFAVQHTADLIFDPSCGDGRLLSAALERKAELSIDGVRRETLASDLFGIDRSPQAVAAALQTGANAVPRDFFDVEPAASLDGFTLPAGFDAVIGNPPYIRQEVMGSEDKTRVSALLETARIKSPSIFWPQFSRRSDIYVFFFAHAARFLREGGRLVFITASSWLDVDYGAALRGFMLNNFRIVAILESGAESFFEDASINTAITVLERESKPECRAENRIRFVRLTEPLRNQPAELARLILSAEGSTECSPFAIRLIDQSDLLERSQAGESWGRHLRADDVFFRVMKRGGGTLKPLAEMALVRFGVKTGANEFFYVASREQSESSGREIDARLRPLAEVAAVRRGLTTGANEFFYLKATQGEHGSGGGNTEAGELDAAEYRSSRFDQTWVEDGLGARHLIEARFLAPVVFSLKQISSITLDDIPNGKLFFNCPAGIDQLEGTRALEYIRKGEQAGYHARPSCAGRQPWYAVARGMKPAPLLIPSKVGERWLVALNSARVFEDKKLYGVFPGAGVSEPVLAALLNSTWARYYAEITCRQMTGAQAIADIDVRVAERIMIPDPRELPPQMKDSLQAALAAVARRPVSSVFVEITREDRRRLDELVLEAIGFTESGERTSVLEQLYSAVTELVRRRLDRSRRAVGLAQHE